MVHIRKDNRHARKELVSVFKCESQRGTPNRDYDVWLSRRVPCAQITHEIVPILPPGNARGRGIRRKFTPFRAAHAKARPSTLDPSFSLPGWTTEHQHCF